MNDHSTRSRPIGGPETREKILATAARLFHEQGYNATGVATILREAGVNAGSLYHFFPSKEALLKAVLEWYHAGLRPMVTDHAEAATDDPVERIFALMGLYRRGLEMTGCTLGCPIGNLALEVGDSHPEVRPLIDANFRQWAQVVAGWLDDPRAGLRPGVDREALAHFVLTVMEGGIMQARAASGLGPFDQAVAQLRVYVDALRVEN